MIQDVDHHAVPAQQRHRRGVDVDVVERHQVTDVGDRDVDGAGVGPFDAQAVVLAADAARFGQPVGTAGRAHAWRQDARR